MMSEQSHPADDAALNAALRALEALGASRTRGTIYVLVDDEGVRHAVSFSTFKDAMLDCKRVDVLRAEIDGDVFVCYL